MAQLYGEWRSADLLAVVEPTLDEVRPHAAALAAAYNDPHNHTMMANTTAFSEADVVEHYAYMASEGARPLLLFFDGALAGDADLRGFAGDTGEMAILIAARGAQGKGLGTRFALIVHALAFRVLGLSRVYVSILPENAASLRLFQKLGYRVDESPEARAHADDPRDVCMSVGRGEVEGLFGRELAEIAVRA